jgi:thiol:disulfide interchange protein DsbC
MQQPTCAALLSALLLLPALLAHAQGHDAEVKKAFEARFGSERPVERVTRTDHGGLYEVLVGDEILYVDENVTFAIQGSLIDAKTHRNVTRQRLEQLSFIAWKDLPLHLAIKQVKGNGARKLAIFEDANCGYCKVVRKSLQEVDNVTIYTFMYPILSPDSTEKAKAFWCAADGGKSLDDWMIRGKAPATTRDCAYSPHLVLALGKKHRIAGTPTIFFPDDTREPGALAVDRLKAKLDAQVQKRR